MWLHTPPQIVSGILLIAGLIFLFNNDGNLTGAVIGLSPISTGFSFILGLVLILGAILLFIGSRGLEKIVADDDERIRALGKERFGFFLRHHVRKYGHYLQANDLIPLRYRDQRAYVQKLLSEHPALANQEYTKDNALEFIEYFKHSPNKKVIQSQKRFKTKINWKIDERLRKITEKYSQNDLLWVASNRKVYQLSESGELGTLGKSYKVVPSTSGKYVYLRDRGSGARIFLRRIAAQEYDLIAIVGGGQKKRDQKKVFERIQELYQDEEKHR